MTVSTTTMTPIREISAKLRGKTLTVPNLRPMFSQWPYRVSPHLKELEKTVEAKLQEWIPDEQVRQNARDIDLALFSAAWWPDSSLDRLETMAWYTLWIILWDDVIEDSTFPGSVASSEDLKIEWLHEEALKYVKYELGLCDETTISVAPLPPTKYCGLFKYCAEPFRAECTIPERQRIYNEIKYYMDCCEAEQKYFQTGALPTLERYWDHRFGSSSVNTYNALGEYMCGKHIPPELFNTEEMKTMWFELNRHIVAMNDLASLKNEIQREWLGLIPIQMYEASQDLEAAVAFAIDMALVAGQKTAKAADDLVAMVSHDPEAQANVRAYVEGFKTNLTGNYYWSYVPIFPVVSSTSMA
ncbi:Isoprenoid synthase domain containing protein [Naviculisporaceae sp. PSN 640]